MKKLILTSLVLCFSGFLFAQVPPYEKGGDPDAYKITTKQPTTTVNNISYSGQEQTCKKGFSYPKTSYSNDNSSCKVSIGCTGNNKSIEMSSCSIEQCELFDHLAGLRYTITNVVDNSNNKCQVAISFDGAKQKAKGI